MLKLVFCLKIQILKVFFYFNFMFDFCQHEAKEISGLFTKEKTQRHLYEYIPATFHLFFLLYQINNYAIKRIHSPPFVGNPVEYVKFYV